MKKLTLSLNLVSLLSCSLFYATNLNAAPNVPDNPQAQALQLICTPKVRLNNQLIKVQIFYD
ncbi:hypothetical protein [Avibacterium paragallinarum]|uniref:hypothetical protein n=1 Tax=Avibacterium paragallinarum TaxID=728 RepID=UPI00102A9245|nr:hypothetical protein [Avibacterium paragallinarum]RZN56656.1 hypothetical protein EIG78_08720 [Avibacterium paragallinarum]